MMMEVTGTALLTVILKFSLKSWFNSQLFFYIWCHSYVIIIILKYLVRKDNVDYSLLI